MLKLNISLYFKKTNIHTVVKQMHSNSWIASKV